MAISFVGAGPGRNSSDAGPLTVATHSSTLTGDLLIMVASHAHSSQIPTPSGWNLLATGSVGSLAAAVFWRFAPASGAQNHQVACQGISQAQIVTFRSTTHWPVNPFTLPDIVVDSTGTQLQASVSWSGWGFAFGRTGAIAGVDVDITTDEDAGATLPTTHSGHRARWEALDLEGSGTYEPILATTGNAPKIFIATAFTENLPPSAPTLTSPADGEPADVNDPLDFVFSTEGLDPDSDLVAYTLRRKIGEEGGYKYWNGSDWQDEEDGSTQVAGVTPSLPAGWGDDADDSHFYSVKVWDEWEASEWSAEVEVIPSVRANPTITNPAVDGEEVEDLVTVTWTVDSQTKKRVRLLVDDDGSPGAQESDSGILEDSDPSYELLLINPGVSYWIEVTTWNAEGLPSVPALRRVFTVFPADPPNVTVFSPSGTISTGGPVLTVTWSYSQSLDFPQGQFRVRLNDGDSDVYDSDWVDGDNTSWLIDFAANSLPGELAGTVIVEVKAIPDLGWKTEPGQDDSSFTLQWGQPHCTILSPTEDQVLTSSTVTAKWTFADERQGKTQARYRVRLLRQSDQAELYDSGWRIGAETQFEVPYALTSFSAYTLEVQLTNNNGIRSD